MALLTNFGLNCKILHGKLLKFIPSYVTIFVRRCMVWLELLIYMGRVYIWYIMHRVMMTAAQHAIVILAIVCVIQIKGCYL